MAFQIKDFVSIVVSMINHMKATQDKVTDFNVGSVARTLVEAPAQEIEQLYIQMYNGLREAIPTAVFRSFQFDALPIRPASGAVTMTADPGADFPVVVPAGTVIKAPGTQVKYLTLRDVTLTQGAQTAEVRVVADVPGPSGNIGAGQVAILDFPIDGLARVFNRLPITGGANEETDSERLLRFGEFIRSISRGTPFALRFAVAQAIVQNQTGETIESVERVGLQESAGRVAVYIYGSSGAPSPDLIFKAQQILDGYIDESGQEVAGYRAAGVRTDALAMAERSLDFTMSVEMLDGYPLTDAVRGAVVTELSTRAGLTLPGEVLFVDELETAALRVTGVRRALASLNENIVCEQNQVLVLGTVTVVGI